MSFKERARESGAFGPEGIPKDIRYYVTSEKVGLGWAISEQTQLPCLTGFFSEGKQSDLRKALRKLAHIMCPVFRDHKHEQVLATVDFVNPCFKKLLKFYQRAGFTLAGECPNGVVLVVDLERLERF